jgi:uncharacterized protein (TIGR03083 family)
MHVDHDTASDAFVEALDSLLVAVHGLADADVLEPSRCRGWSVGDVVVHLHLGLQEMLLGLVTPSDQEPDTDAATYWQGSVPTNDPGADDLAPVLFVRRVASAYRTPSGLIAHFDATARGVLGAVARSAPATLSFQQRTLNSGNYLATWAVEVAVHHLDLTATVDLTPPASSGLALARQTIESLAGGRLPAHWPDDHVTLVGTGRLQLNDGQREEAGPVAEHLPVLS